jgi:DNA-directed RNA polymerase subunit RPC12/RpoP
MPKGWYGKTRKCADCGKEFTLRSKHDQILCSRACAAKRNTGQRKVTRTPITERFWRYVMSGAPDDCWEWAGGRDHHGYGRLHGEEGRSSVAKAHRVSYEIHIGPIPLGGNVLHTCDNPPCCNPTHLFLGTKADNTADMIAKGRDYKVGIVNRLQRQVLSDDQVREIRERYAAGASAKKLSSEFGYGPKYIYAIVSGERRQEAGGLITRRRGHYRKH